MKEQADNKSKQGRSYGGGGGGALGHVPQFLVLPGTPTKIMLTKMDKGKHMPP